MTNFALFRAYAEIAGSFRDIALLKALYWRMFKLFRWLCQFTASLVQSPIYSLVKDLALIESDEELEAYLRDG